MKMITIGTTVEVDKEKVWQFWTQPEHIIHWNSASDDWHTPKAESDLRTGGRFTSRMEAKDGSMGFDFGGTFDEVNPPELLNYTLDDGRKVSVTFEENEGVTKITENFEPEDQNPLEMQEQGWQAILNNFKKYAESVA